MWRRPVVTILLIAVAIILTLPMRAQQKPFTQEQVNNMVRDGFGDESGAKLIEQRGIDFVPAEGFLQNLKAAGASEAFLKALRAAKPPGPAGAKKPLNQVQVFALLVGQVASHRVIMLMQERGIDFEPTDDYLQEVRLIGGEDELIGALKRAKVTNSSTVDLAAQARQSEIRKHAARGVEFYQKRQYGQAEHQYRTALQLDPQNAGLYVSLAYILIQQRRWDDAESAAREALRLDPDNDMAHNNLGLALGNKGDYDGAFSEYREALRLNPDDDVEHSNLGVALMHKGDLDGAISEGRVALRLNSDNDLAHANLGAALQRKGDWDGAIAEYREALRLNPDNDVAHSDLGLALAHKGDLNGAISEGRAAVRLNPDNDLVHANLGVALGHKGDWDGEITEEREALRLNPNNEQAHVGLGAALGNKGDWNGMITEEREALRLNPNNEQAHVGLGLALQNKGDWDGAIAEYREALRLNPDNDLAHSFLGFALAHKGDWDGMITEEREALRLNANNEQAHCFLGVALEKKGDRRGAFEEYRAAYTLDPSNAVIKQNYERLLQLEGTNPEAVEKRPGVLFAGYGSPAASFQFVFLEVENALTADGVQIANKPSALHQVNSDSVSMQNLLNIAQRQASDSLLYLTIEHGSLPTNHYARLQCYDVSGKLLWEEKASSMGHWAPTDRAAAKAVGEQLKKKLKAHVGKPGLPLRSVESMTNK